MQPEKRRFPRRRVNYPVRLRFYQEAAPTDGILCDISAGGARLTVEAAEKIPEEFTLLLSANSSAPRRCRVVWRSPNQVGVCFPGVHEPEISGNAAGFAQADSAELDC